MKKFALVLVLAAAAALAIWLGIHGRSPMAKSTSTAVTALLPKDTLAFVHVPDFKGARAKLHETDIYKLWREPAVQDFLQKPLAKAPQTDAARVKLQQIEALEMRDAFLAITSWENKELKMLAGFRFKGTAADAEKVIGQWRARANREGANKHETVEYAQHRIDVVSDDTVSVATVYDGNWFFAGNDLATLKTLLDRADKRVTDSSMLAADEEFIAAFKHMPASYAAFVYGRLDRYFEKLAATMPKDGKGAEQMALLKQIRSISAATGFQEGKVRDVLFVAMPKRTDADKLTRSSLALATGESFLYAAGFLHLPKQFALPADAAGAGGVPAAMQRLMDSLSAKGITADDWKAAFGPEFGIIGDWPASARVPSLVATLPVLDKGRAGKILEAVTAGDDKSWTPSEKGDVQYYTEATGNPMVPIAPTIGLSNQLLMLGLDRNSVEAAMSRSGSNSGGLSGSATFKSAEHLVPPGGQSFTYIDTAMFYARLDAAVRPMLIMAAALMPTVADTVDLGKLPPAEVITKHLSPMVMSTNYVDNGYVTESLGPVSIYGAALGMAAATGAGAGLYQHQMGTGMSNPPTVPPSAPDEQAEPSPTPDETP